MTKIIKNILFGAVLGINLKIEIFEKAVEPSVVSAYSVIFDMVEAVGHLELF